METEILGRGVFTVAEAARLLHESPAGVRRWAFGYSRRRNGEPVTYQPLIQTDLPVVEGERAITFIELVELMCIRGFLRAGASWHLVHEAARTAARLFRTEHPLAMREFFADPSGIYTRLAHEDGSESFVELSGDAQYAVDDLLRPYLGQIDFDASQLAERWWPLGRAGDVVIDPRINFGRPVVASSGVPAEQLASAVAVEGGDVERVAWLYSVRPSAVDSAMRFSEWLNAA